MYKTVFSENISLKTGTSKERSSLCIVKMLLPIKNSWSLFLNTFINVKHDPKWYISKQTLKWDELTEVYLVFINKNKRLALLGYALTDCFVLKNKCVVKKNIIHFSSNAGTHSLKIIILFI